MMYSAVDKDPNAVSDYTFDWSDFLGSDTIATSTFPSFPAGITLDSASYTDTTVQIWLSGGTTNRDYRITNRITTDAGRTEDWLLLVRVTDNVVIPIGPPYATVAEAVAYQPAADSAEAMKIEMVLEDASDLVQRLAPRPATILGTLSDAMDASQVTIPLKLADALPIGGTVRIDDEVMQYFGKTSTTGSTYYSGQGNLVTVLRGRLGTTPDTHAADAPVELVDYPLKARRAELQVFEWLWSTRGYVPGRSGEIGEESYSIGPELLNLVKRTMGSYYSGRSRSIGVGSTFPRYPRQGWIGNI